MSDLVGNPEDRFSRVAAQLMPRLMHNSQGPGFLAPLEVHLEGVDPSAKLI